MESTLQPSSIVEVLTTGTEADKRKAIDALDACTETLQRYRVRLLVMEELSSRFAPSMDGDDETNERKNGRAWLLSALGRVSGDDERALGFLEQYLDPEFERNPWGRYWALEGVTAGAGSSVARIAQTALKKDSDPLVQNLALAILARQGDVQAVRTLREKMDENPWAVLRALRIVTVDDKAIIDRLIKIVQEAEYTDITYDALVALGRLPPKTPEAEEAAAVVAGYVRRSRWPMYDSMRTKALSSLGQLQSKIAVPVLLEELTDENPMIVLQAARALEAVVGTRMATRRIVESAMENQRVEAHGYANAIRALKRGGVIDELEATITAGGSQQGDAALLLLREIGGAEALDRLRALRRTTEEYVAAQSKADAELRTSLDEALMEARRGFRIVTYMDIAVFGAGLALLGLGIFFALTRDESAERLGGLATAVGGVFSVVLKDWLGKSRDRIEPSIRGLASIQALFHGYLRQMRQVDQAYTQRMLAGGVEAADVKEYMSMVSEATEQAVLFLSETQKGMRDETRQASPDDDRPGGPDTDMSSPTESKT